MLLNGSEILVECLKEQGVDTIVEIGPGNAISKFVKKTVSDVNVYSIDSVEDFNKVVEELAQYKGLYRVRDYIE